MKVRATQWTRIAKRTVIAIALLGLVATAATACTNQSPGSASSSPKPTPTASRSERPHQPLVVPAVQVGELARLVYLADGDRDHMSLAVPASKYGYAVEFTCTASSLSTRVGYELYVNNSSHTFIGGGSTNCDGMDQDNTAIYPGQAFKSVTFELTGDYRGNTSFAVLAPAPH